MQSNQALDERSAAGSSTEALTAPGLDAPQAPGNSAEPPRDLGALQSAATRACALLRVLAHPDRLVLLCRLAQSECNVSALEAELGIRQPSLSQQLGVLRSEGLVQTRRDGKHIHYALASEDAAALLRVLHERFCVPDTTTRPCA